MREITTEEALQLERRRGKFDEFLSERMPVLADFADALGLENPPMIVADAERYLAAVDRFVRNQEVESESDRIWIVTRLGYFLGEVLVQRLGGCWLVNDFPESRYFLRYVVGRFSRIANAGAMVDPFDAASVLVSEPPGRSLLALVEEVESDLESA